MVVREYLNGQLGFHLLVRKYEMKSDAEISYSSYDENLYATVINNISKLGETVKMPVELNDILGSGDVVILGTSIKNGEVLQVTKVHQDHNNTQEYIYMKG